MKQLFFILTVAFVAASSPVLAVDLTQSLTTSDGKEFTGTDGKPLGLTPLIVIQNALLTAPATDEPEKKANYILSEKIREQAKDYTPTPDDNVRIRKALAATQVTAVYGRVTSILDTTF